MILIDDRLGSFDLINHFPLNVCSECGGVIMWHEKGSGVGSRMIISRPQPDTAKKAKDKVRLCTTNPTHANPSASHTTIDSADVCFIGKGPEGDVLVGVEVKTVGDLVTSLQSGRLQAEQLPKMLDAYDVRWLVYYGGVKPGANGDLLIQSKKGSWVNYSHVNSKNGDGKGEKRRKGIPFSYLDAFLCSPSFTGLGVGVKYCPWGIEEAAAWIGTLHHTWAKEWGKHRSMRTFNKSAFVCLPPGMGEVEKQIALTAASLPGIKFERGVVCSNYFESVLDMVTADEGRWAGMEGVGKVIARSVTQAIRRRRSDKPTGRH